MKTPRHAVRNRYVFAAVFAALIAVSGFFKIPVPGSIVPVVLKNLFVVLSGTILGGFYGAAAVVIFIAAGIIGVPVFVIAGGIGVFNTTLGGYIIGYFAAALVSGLVCGLPKISEKKVKAFFLLRLCAASFLGFALIDLCGVFYMMFLNSMSLKAAMTAGLVPFILGDSIKLAASVPLALKLRPVAARYINPDEGK